MTNEVFYAKLVKTNHQIRNWDTQKCLRLLCTHREPIFGRYHSAPKPHLLSNLKRVLHKSNKAFLLLLSSCQALHRLCIFFSSLFSHCSFFQECSCFVSFPLLHSSFHMFCEWQLCFRHALLFFRLHFFSLLEFVLAEG